jgi:hypothetical protein
VELDVKALGFVARALEHRIAWYEEQLQRGDLSEDDRSDLTNDMFYLLELLGSFERERDRLIGRQ